MLPDKKLIRTIVAELKKHKTYFIAGHLNPDGDTVGSALALASMLTRMGKECEVFSHDPIPANLRFMAGAEDIIISDRTERTFDCAVILECADLARMGGIIGFNQADVFINIDHHAHFNKFGKINYIDPTASSSAEQVFYVAQQLGTGITKEEAECLYVGLVTDTGKFQQNNTTPEAFMMAGELAKAGVVPSHLYDKLYATKTLSSLKLLALALSNMKCAAGGRIACLKITSEMYRKAKSSPGETEEIINYAMTIAGVSVAVMLRETAQKGIVKASFRSRYNVDVNQIARHFGGGGHKSAAGCSIQGSMVAVEKKVLTYTASVL